MHERTKKNVEFLAQRVVGFITKYSGIKSIKMKLSGHISHMNHYIISNILYAKNHYWIFHQPTIIKIHHYQRRYTLNTKSY